MKRLICLAILLIIMVALLCSCNQSIGIGNLSFEHLYYNIYGNGGCLDVKSWHNNETGIEVKATDGTSFYFSEGTYILVESKATCPFCD